VYKKQNFYKAYATILGGLTIYENAMIEAGPAGTMGLGNLTKQVKKSENE
jgi:hypothetical protein